jgi:putative MATE family efflux protein
MNRPDMVRDPVGKALLRLLLPMIPGTLSIVLFNLADTFFVGQLGAVPLAAMSFSFPVVLISGGLSMGLGIGTTAHVSRALGEGKRDFAKLISSQAHLLAFLVVVTIAGAGLLTIDPLFTALGADAETLPLIRTYMTIWYSGMPFVILPMIGMNVLQATGDTKTTGLVLTLSVFLNVILDPLLIFGIGPFPEMGIAGAALATVISRASSFIIIGTIIIRREHLLSLRFGGIRSIVHEWGEILFIGIPAAATNILLPISQGVVTRLVADYGTESVAGFGAATRVESFALVFVLATSMIVTPFVGRNLGAGQNDRVKSTHNYASLFSLAWGSLVFVVFLLAARPIASIFNDNPEVVSVTSRYLRIMAVSYGVLGLVNMSSAAFNGIRKPLTAAGVAAVRLFLLYVPLAILGGMLFELEGIFWGAAIGNLLGGAFAYLWFRRTKLPEPRVVAQPAEGVIPQPGRPVDAPAARARRAAPPLTRSRARNPQ